jgi:HAD superfamily hydrolase (TIGR01509 family)
MRSGVSFIYFDLGGVLLIDFSGNDGWESLASDLGLNKDQANKLDKIWDNWDEDLCAGRMDLKELVEKFRKLVDIPVGYDLYKEIITRFDPNQFIKPLIDETLRQKRIGILSNAYPNMIKGVMDKKLIPLVDYSVIVDSSVVGYSKPEKEIYKLSESRAGVDPSNILFVDNLQKNLDPARHRGWKTFLYDPKNPEESTKKLANYLYLKI